MTHLGLNKLYILALTYQKSGIRMPKIVKPDFPYPRPSQSGKKLSYYQSISINWISYSIYKQQITLIWHCLEFMLFKHYR